MTKERRKFMNKKHPSAWDPAIMLLNILVSVIGSIIGLELIARLGISTNTSIIGALFAIIIARIPLKIFQKYKDINTQNLVQTAMSGATFAASNGIFLSIGIPYLLGRHDLVIPMMVGASLAVIIDATILYKVFDTEMFPAKEAWAPGIAAAEAMLAVAEKGKNSVILMIGMVGGIVGKIFGIPTDILGVGWIGNMWALGAFGVGLLISEYTPKFFNIKLGDYYVPHGVMIGAGFVALIQMILILQKKSKKEKEAAAAEAATGKVEKKEFTRSLKSMKFSLAEGFGAYILVSIVMAIMCGFSADMSAGMFVWWIIFAALSAIISELIVGISAMHSGWFPAFATAFIFLILGMLFGFPPAQLAILVGFTSATGPAFADMAYDLKSGYIVRGNGEDVPFEMEGRRQQYIAKMVSAVIAILVVLFTYKAYFEKGMLAPVDAVYVATIDAGTNMAVAKNLIIWAIPGALLQAIGGSDRQLGVLFATGLLIASPMAGITVLVGLLIRYIVVKKYGDLGQSKLYILGAGFITGAALYSFFSSTMNLGKKLNK
ncbi:OPT family oligopeptide transporter [Clostridium sp. AF24-2LB]|nr:OPT family oligopeptide transporter [Clostridium sp. AF24-2LB]